jgi:hypothetical protein
MARILALILVASLLFIGCSDDDCPTCPKDSSVGAIIASSLHGTTDGQAYFYSAANGGLELLTNVPYGELACIGCHVDPGKCETCHIASTAAPKDDMCYPCHSRQAAEAFKLGYSDVHRDAGFQCVNCHTMDGVHGDGNKYNSLLEDGAIKIKCESCHPSPPEDERGHNSVHMEKVHCTACHMQATTSCQSCHFDTEISEDKKIFAAMLHEWTPLVKWRGKLHQANSMTATYQGQTFMVWAPYVGHSVYTPEDTDDFCDKCHANALIREYKDQGTMTVVWWDEDAQALDYFKGVVFVPEDWKTAMKWAFATTSDGGQTWTYLKDDPDLQQDFLFGEPIAEDDLPFQTPQ